MGSADSRVLLVVPPSGKTCEVFAELTALVAPEHNVVPCNRPSSSTVRHFADALVRALDTEGVGRADVFGSSAGAVIGLELMSRFPDRVRTLVAHEPPAVSLLPDADELRSGYDRVHEIYCRLGSAAAARAFLAHVGAVDPPTAAVTKLAVDFDAGMGRELLPVTSYEPDVSALKRSAQQVVLASGTAGPPSVGRRVAGALAVRLGAEVMRFPGNHWGYASQPGVNRPAEFAARLREVLRRPVR